MSTRFTQLSSRRTKQTLVNLLFAQKNAGKGPAAHRKLDGASYSYSELRNAYLRRLQEIHPDKHSANVRKNVGHKDSKVSLYLHDRFVELQDAWDKYEEVARMMTKAGNQNDEEANFTMFGVGCSFSDSPQERDLRDEITDQACRGWFSAGALAEKASTDRTKQMNTPLCDDDMFVSITEEVKVGEGSSMPPKYSRRRSLVDDAIPPNKRLF